MSNSEKLKINVLKADSSLNIEFTGYIDEDTNLSEIDLQGVITLVFEWAQVKGINSCGIREWIQWIEKIPPDTKVHIMNCPRVMITQIGMIKGFLPKNTTIESFFVPYFCEKCEATTSVLFRNGKDFQTILGTRLKVSATII